MKGAEEKCQSHLALLFFFSEAVILFICSLHLCSNTFILYSLHSFQKFILISLLSNWYSSHSLTLLSAPKALILYSFVKVLLFSFLHLDCVLLHQPPADRPSEGNLVKSSHLGILPFRSGSTLAFGVFLSFVPHLYVLPPYLGIRP